MVARALPSKDELFAILETVKDPEIPVVSVVELGIVRDAVAYDAGVTVTITPTYSGCPAMREIESDIRSTLEACALGPVEIVTVYSPAWTTDWLSATARAKLEAYGIAPPGAASSQDALVPLTRRIASIACPYCASTSTERQSEFGSTACKSIWVCRTCQQPFEEFKAF